MIFESHVEDAALAWLGALGYAVLHGPDIAVGEPAAERIDPSYRDALLDRRLRQALARLNPELPPDALRRHSPEADTNRCPVPCGAQPRRASTGG